MFGVHNKRRPLQYWAVQKTLAHVEHTVKGLGGAGVGRLWACMRREAILQMRTLVVIRAKVMQVGVMALVAATLYLRTHIHPIGPNDGQEIAGFLFYSTIQMLFNGIAFLSITVSSHI